MDYSLPGSYVRGIFQARTQEWIAISFSKLPLISFACHPFASWSFGTAAFVSLYFFYDSLIMDTPLKNYNSI